jgi:cell division protein FtsQ
MTRSPSPSKRPRAESLHGAAVAAPTEDGFVSVDTPEPPRAKGKRGARNKRGERSEAAPAPPPRLGAVWAAIKLSLGVAIVLGASLAIAWGARQFALTTPRFAVVELDVEGNRRASDAEIVRVAGLERGGNVFRVDLEGAERQMLQNPWIQSAKVTRRLPGTIVVQVTEREAAAIAVLGDDLYLVTPKGLPFKVLEDRDPHDLPVVTGLGPRDFAIDRDSAVERLGEALELIRYYETLPLATVHPAEELHLETDGAAVMTIGSKPITLHLGKEGWRQRLAMAARVLGKLQRSGERPGILFLDNEAHSERVVVRMR